MKVAEEIHVLFHAALLGRTDVIRNALSALKGVLTDHRELRKSISTGRPDDGATPLHLAASFAHQDAVRALLSSGADPSVRNAAQNSPYQVAQGGARSGFHVYLFEQIASGNIHTVGLLLDGGVSPSVVDEKGDSALHWAVSFGHIDIVTILLEAGAEVDMANSEGHTPLTIACIEGNGEIAHLLLNEGADPRRVSIADKEGRLSAPILELLNTPFTPSYPLRAKLEERRRAGTDGASASTSRALGELAFFQSDAEDWVREASTSAESVPWDLASDDQSSSLVIWPPAQRQRRCGSVLELGTAETIFLCVSTEIDIFPLLTWSGLMDALDTLGFHTQVKRSAPGCRLRLCIDQRICPGRHRFNLSITTQCVQLLASDSTGLLYAVYAFIQILQLHSEVRVANGVTKVSLPCVSISDWPDVENRAVLWSFRASSRNSSAVLREMVEFLSKLRINMIHLIIDTLTSPKFVEDLLSNEITTVVSSKIGSASTDSTPATASNSTANAKKPALAAKIFALEEVCGRNRVELVPAIIFTYLSQSLHLELLQNFCSVTLSVTFLYDPRVLAQELQAAGAFGDEGASVDSVERACRRRVEQILLSVRAAGVTALILSESGWVKRVANPERLATDMGLRVVDCNVSEIYPPALFLKPTLCLHEFIKTIAGSARHSREGGTSLSVFPAFIDADFMVPSLVLKYCCLLYAGFAWNSSAVADMQVMTDTAVIKEVTSLLIFSQHSTAAVDIQAILSVFTGEIFSTFDVTESVPGTTMSVGTSEMTHSLYSTAAPATGSSNTLDSSASTSFGMCELLHAEKVMWSWITSPAASVADAVVPSKAEASLCLRYYRRVLNNAKWRSNPHSKGLIVDFAFGGTTKSPTQLTIERDEFFAVMQLMSVICRALVLSYNAIDKAHKSGLPSQSSDSYTLRSLLSALPHGLTSDIANALLEALGNCAGLWRKRFEAVLFSTDIDSLEASMFVKSNGTVSSAVTRFLTIERPIIPCKGLFELFVSRMPGNVDADETFKKLLT